VDLINAVERTRERGFANVVLETANEFNHSSSDHRILRGPADAPDIYAKFR
jgi:hypothetical protein